MIEKNSFYAITGAPGTGKTTLINLLAKDFITVSEPAREIIAEQRAIGGEALWGKNTELFLKLLLDYSVTKFKSQDCSKIIFFDRGIPDNEAYAISAGLHLAKYEEASNKYRYNRKVFLLSPWQEIYQIDNERKMPYIEICKFHQLLVEAYKRNNYELVEVPKFSVEDRLQFIKESISLS